MVQVVGVGLSGVGEGRGGRGGERRDSLGGGMGGELGLHFDSVVESGGSAAQRQCRLAGGYRVVV